MKIFLYNSKSILGWSVLLSLMFCEIIAFGQSPEKNHIVTRSPRIPVTDGVALSNAASDKSKVQTSIQYLDGLGRPIQAVDRQASPMGRDLVQPVVYDAIGREARKYLPYVAGDTDYGSYKAGAATDDLRFYNLNQTRLPQAAKVELNNYPYRETAFEPSPLNRVVEQGKEGGGWQLTSRGVSGGGHTQKISYSSNNSVPFTDIESTRRVAQYKVSVATDGIRTLTLIDNAAYDDNELHVTIFKDENWTDADGRAGTIHEFKDKEGRLIVKRHFNIKNGVLEMLSTYYVYDDFGNLCFVLPPGAEPDRNTLMATTTVQAFGYRYRYDHRNRLIEKRLPGKAVEQLVYNKLDQVVATQDAALRSRNLWQVIKYDGLGRVIMTGSWGNGSVNGGNGTSATTRVTLQDQINAEIIFWEKRTSTGVGYDNLSWPRTGFALYSINYYDDYIIPNLPSQRQYVTYAGNAKSEHTVGMLTATLTKSLHDEVELWKAMYYDEEGRLIQINSNNHIGGKDIVNNVYDFNDQLVKSERVHSSAGSSDLVIANRYSYDHVGRKIDTYQKTGADAEILLSHNEYNELGQLVDKKLHRKLDQNKYLQSVDYRYTIQGWLTRINDEDLTLNNTYNTDSLTSNDRDKFGMALYFTGGEVKQYNGNISATTWKTTLKPQLTYQFEYDKLNRLLAAESYTNGNSANKDRDYSERLTYDNMGNITSLQRFGLISSVRREIDNLAYNYDGNQHTRIDDNSPDAANKLYGFADGSQADAEMEYDDDGNLIKDLNKGVASITYSKINTVKEVVFSSTTKIFYEYDRTGKKLQKRFTENNIVKTVTDYVDGIEYETLGNGPRKLMFVQTEEGRGRNDISKFTYEYDLKDHLGNTRVTIQASGTDVTQTTAEVLHENSYYAFGMTMPGMSIEGTPKNKYLYNGKELQEERSLNLYDYSARFYDPATGKWNRIDPLSELMASESPYNYAFNNPVRYTDPYGLAPNDGVGADGLTNEQWLESSRPNSSIGLAASFRVENRQNEIETYRNEFNLANGELDWNAPGKQGEEVFRIYDGNSVHIYFSSWSGFKNKSYRRGGWDKFIDGFVDAEGSDLVSMSSMIGSQGLVLDALKQGFKLEAGQFTSSQRISKVQSLKMAKITSYSGKFLGVVGGVATFYEGYQDGHLSSGDWVKIGINTITIFTPYGWVYGLVDLGVGFTTGTTLTDRIGSGIDTAIKEN